jgi:lysophospholipase L1-like esterase
MNAKNWLRVSLTLNILLLSLFIVMTVVYRDKLIQRFVTWKGHGKIVMFGNSITAQGKWVELLGRTDVVNSGLPGQCTYHFLELIQQQVVDVRPEICFVMGGINDITVGVAQEKLQANYRAILERLVKNGIVPVVTLTIYEQNDPVSKKEVKILNDFLIQYCTDHNITYLDLNPLLSDATGLKPAYAVDKTHLNTKAYKIWAKEITRVLNDKGI